MKEITFLLPKNYVDVVKNNIKNYEERIKEEVIHQILNDLIIKRQYSKDDGMALNMAILKKNYTYAQNSFIFLRKFRILKIVKPYAKGEHSFHYDFDIQPSKELVEVNYNERTKLYKKLEKSFGKLTKKPTKKAKDTTLIQFHLNQTLRNIQFDYDSALRFLEENENQYTSMQYSQRLCTINSLKVGNEFLRLGKVNKTNNRFDSPVTRLARELRCYIRFKNQDALNTNFSMDISNSQPCFMNKKFKEIIELLKTGQCNYQYLSKDEAEAIKSEISCPVEIMKFNEEIKKWHDTTTKGRFYEHITELYNNSEFGKDTYERNDLKLIFMSIAYGSDCTYNRIVAKQFMEEFPIIDKIIRISKNKISNREFCISLQKIESKLFIENIVDKLLKNNIEVITIHDSIIVDYDNIELAYKIFKEEMNNFFDSDIDIKVESMNNKVPNKSFLKDVFKSYHENIMEDIVEQFRLNFKYAA